MVGIQLPQEGRFDCVHSEMWEVNSAFQETGVYSAH